MRTVQYISICTVRVQAKEKQLILDCSNVFLIVLFVRVSFGIGSKMKIRANDRGARMRPKLIFYRPDIFDFEVLVRPYCTVVGSKHWFHLRLLSYSRQRNVNCEEVKDWFNSDVLHSSSFHLFPRLKKTVDATIHARTRMYTQF